MHSPCKGAHPGLQPPMAQPTASEIRCSERQETWPAKGTRERMHFPVPPPRIAEEQRAVAWRVSPVRIRIPVQGRRSEESEQGSVKMEEQGPRRPIRRESLESKGKRSPAGQVETFGDLLPQADLRQIKQEPEEEEELKQHWDAQWQDFLKTMQPPCSSWETPQAPIPPHSGDGVFLTSFKGATDDSQWPSGRAGETDQTLFPDTEGLLGKQGSVKMEEQGPRRPIRRESLESKGKRSPAGQVETFGDLLPQADLRQIKQEPEEEEELKQHWDAQWQDFLKTMQPPCSSWETPQAPIPPHSGDGVFLTSFKGATDDSQWPSGRAGETDQTLFPDTEGLLGKELWPVEDVVIKSPKSEQDPLDTENIHLSVKAEGESEEEASFLGGDGTSGHDLGFFDVELQTLSTKVHIVKAMVFPVVMYGSERWTIKKADRQRIDAFELWCWRRLLRVPWTARRSNLSILKEISPECSLEGQTVKLRLQYFGHLMRREDSLEKTLMLGKIEGTRRRGRQRTRWTSGSSRR
ncbi:uncharacterized protein LOC118090069 isoform X17 [Zootoca vivipara]|uniref:uncharacterized protein LOC118090069 isoform X17 n=1 Tax=Zootoca vivipara TaxID=8524 RepID=UPI00293BEBFD|nr:uncharacterized protein LOC118090069 isoform X17 [Zootoca vivipara]